MKIALILTAGFFAGRTYQSLKDFGKDIGLDKSASRCKDIALEIVRERAAGVITDLLLDGHTPQRTYSKATQGRMDYTS